MPRSRIAESYNSSIFYFFFGRTFTLGLLGGLDGEASAYNLGDLGSIPGLGSSPGGGKAYPLQYLSSPWGPKESDTTDFRIFTRKYFRIFHFHFSYCFT